MSIIVVAIIGFLGVMFAAIAPPLIIDNRTQKQRRLDKAEERERRDEEEQRRKNERLESLEREAEVKKRVQEAADQAAEAARLLEKRGNEQAAAVQKVAKDNARAVEATEGALGEMKIVVDQTHGLVNSQMDEQKRLLLAGLERELVQQKEIRALRVELGQKPSSESDLEIEKTEAAISTLEEEIAERVRRLATTDKTARNAHEKMEEKN